MSSGWQSPNVRAARLHALQLQYVGCMLASEHLLLELRWLLDAKLSFDALCFLDLASSLRVSLTGFVAFELCAIKLQ